MDDGAVATGDGLSRNVGFFGLLLTSEGSIIGSGWLFGALACACPAGSRVPIDEPIATVAPSGTSILRIPEAAAGTTLLALSVSSSNSGSPAETADPPQAQ